MLGYPPPPFVNKTHILSLFSASTRSKFYVREPVNAKPNWVKVGLTLGTSVFMWIYLINQHNEDVLEYKRRNGLE